MAAHGSRALVINLNSCCDIRRVDNFDLGRGLSLVVIWKTLHKLQEDGIVKFPNRCSFPLELRNFLESVTFDFSKTTVAVSTKGLSSYAEWATGLGNMEIKC